MYLDKIFKILNNELNLIIKDNSNDAELLYELELIKKESIKIYDTLIQKKYNIILNKKYKEIYEKTLTTIRYIKNKNDNSIMIDYLSEAYISILNYSEIIIDYEVI